MEKAFVPDDEKHVVNFIFFVEVFYLKDIIVEKGVLNMTEKDKMEAGLWYDANNDQELIDQRLVCQDLCFELNQLKPMVTPGITETLAPNQQLFPTLIGKAFSSP